MSRRAPQRLVEPGRHEDPEVPRRVELAPQEEDAVDDEHGVRRGHLDGPVERLVSAKVEDRSHVATVAPGPERIQEDVSKRRDVEAVLEIPSGRVRTTP